MFRFNRRAVTLVAAAAACTILIAPSAEARHHGGRMLTVKARLIPAHLRPGYVGAPGFAGGPPGPVYPAFIDLGYGPVFPFGGWPK